MTFEQKCKVMYEESAAKMIRYLLLKQCKDNSKYSHLVTEKPEFEAFFNEWYTQAKALCLAFQLVREKYKVIENGYEFRKNYAQKAFGALHNLYRDMYKVKYGIDKDYFNTDYLLQKILYDTEIEF